MWFSLKNMLKKYEPLILSKEIHVRCNIAMTDYKKKCKPKNKKQFTRNILTEKTRYIKGDISNYYSRKLAKTILLELEIN